MKKRIISLITILLFAQLLFSETDLGNWQCVKDIKVKGENKYKSFFLDDEVYQYAENDLTDLRIVDENQEFLPYYINRTFKTKEKENKRFDAKIVLQYRSAVKNDFSYTYDFQVIPSNKDIIGNKLELRIDTVEYSKQVEVFGRAESSDWIFIKKDTIYNLNGYSRTSISFNRSLAYNFYRIKIVDNRDDIKINKCTLNYNVLKDKDLEYTKYKDLKFKTEEKDDHSIIKIKNPKNLNIIDMDLSIKGNFNRRYIVYENTTDRTISSGKIYNFNLKNTDISERSIEFTYTPLQSRAFYLKIYNKDDRPLKIEKIRAEYTIDKIIFEDKGSKTYKLSFGNKKADKPDYDIETYKKYIKSEDIDEGSIGRITVLKKGKAASKFNYKLIFNISIIVFSIILVIFLVFVLKKK